MQSASTLRPCVVVHCHDPPTQPLADFGTLAAYTVAMPNNTIVLASTFDPLATSIKRMQKGFTLIELVVVIVILGILAAVALPKFIDLTNEALDASTAGVAGAISSSSAINYGAFVANSSKGVGITGTNVCVNTTLNNI